MCTKNFLRGRVTCLRRQCTLIACAVSEQMASPDLKFTREVNNIGDDCGRARFPIRNGTHVVKHTTHKNGIFYEFVFHLFKCFLVFFFSHLAQTVYVQKAIVPFRNTKWCGYTMFLLFGQLLTAFCVCSLAIVHNPPTPHSYSPNRFAPFSKHIFHRFNDLLA